MENSALTGSIQPPTHWQACAIIFRIKPSLATPDADFPSFGGLLYGYQQGVLGQAAVMHSFIEQFPDVANDSTKLGWLTSILQLGGWAGALSSGVFAQVFSRKYTMFWGALWVILGSYLAAGASTPGFLYSGRFFTGIGVGTLSAVG